MGQSARLLFLVQRALCGNGSELVDGGNERKCTLCNLARAKVVPGERTQDGGKISKGTACSFTGGRTNQLEVTF